MKFRYFVYLHTIMEHYRKIESFVLVLLVLASTISWTVEKHYCMGHLVATSFFSPAENCGMDMVLNAADSEHMSCCNDDILVVEGQDDLKRTFEDLSLEQSVFLNVFAFTYVTSFDIVAVRVFPHEKYPPPILVRDIHLFDQVFLI